jgi:cell division inhibitor SepF
MSALHRLKAYFGMVPAEEFDAAEFDDYHLGDDSQGYDPEFGSGLDRATANAGFATRAGHHAATGHHAAPRTHPSRSPSWAVEPHAAESSVADPWAAQAPVRGSLAIDTAAINTRSTARPPVVPQRVTTKPGPSGNATARAIR